MSDQLAPTRFRPAAMFLAAAMLAATALAGAGGAPVAQAAIQAPARPATQPSGLPVGPIKISPLGDPKLCWMAWGNGSPVTLQSCATTLQGEQWTFTSDGILMNGNGYCLQNGGAGRSGSPGADSVFLSFSGQCAGARSQDWTFQAATGAIENAPGHVCATVRGGAVVDGGTIAARRCGPAGLAPAWSQGSSDLTLARARPGAPAGAPARSGPGARAFTARVAVSNAVKAMTAYAASVTVRAPAGLTVTRLAGTGALSGWSCRLHGLRCQGNLAGDSTGTITVTGTVSSRAAHPAAAVIAAQAKVAGTNQVRRAALTATSPVRLYTPAVAAPAATAHSGPASGVLAFGVIAAVLLVALGTVLAFTGRRHRQRQPARRAEPAPER